VLVLLLLAEAAFMVILATVLAVDLATRHRQTEIGFPLAEVGLCLLAGAGLVVMARGLRRDSRWARSPAITLQLVGLPLAGRLIEFGGIRIALGVPLGLVLLAALVLLFATSSPAAYEPKDRS
jgi:hypothetical protein